MSPFSEVAYTRCAVEPISRLVRRMVAVDGGPLDRPTGLRTYIVGNREVAVIDPDPASAPLLQAILEATAGERITHVLLTHSHGRRSPLAVELGERFGAQVLSGADGLSDRMRVQGPGWTLQAIATPGHTPDHFAFAMAEENEAFCGDLTSGWSTDVTLPPGGDLIDHMASLRAVKRWRFDVLWPAHGPMVIDVAAHLQASLQDVQARERAIMGALSRAGGATAWRLAADSSVSRRSTRVAEAHAILAHLVRLSASGHLMSERGPGLYSPFSLRSGGPARAVAPAARHKARQLPPRPQYRNDILSAFSLAVLARDSQLTPLER